MMTTNTTTEVTEVTEEERTRNEMDEMDAWSEKEHRKMTADYARMQKIQLNTLEIERLPPSMEDTGLGAIVAGITKIAPLSASVCYKDDDRKRTVGLIKFHSQKDATKALERLRYNIEICGKWRMRLMASPDD